jgi:lysophospholipase L1-like esterase
MQQQNDSVSMQVPSNRAIHVRKMLIPNTLRIVLIGDSHVRRSVDTFYDMYPGINLYACTAGSKMEVIRNKYEKYRLDIDHFKPTVIVLHQGHNDLSFDQRRNPHPALSKTVGADTLSFAQKIATDNDNAIVYISSIYPRSHTRYAGLAKSQIDAYNSRAKRHGNRTRKLAKDTNNIKHIMNVFPWRKISKAEARTDIFDREGLHLNLLGRKLQVNEWLKGVVGDVQYEPEELEEAQMSLAK